MMDLKISQAFMLLALNDKGGVASVGSMRIRAYVIASAVLELALDNVISISDEQVTVNQALPAKQASLRAVYEAVKAADSLNFKQLAKKLVTDRGLFKETFEAVGDTLVDLNVVTKDNGGVLGNAVRFVGGDQAKQQIVEQIRAELLEEGTVTAETIAMTSLLAGSRTLKNYFSKFEENDLNTKLEEIRQDDANKDIFALVDRISRTITTIIASVG